MQNKSAPPENGLPDADDAIRPPEAFAALLDQVLAGLPERKPENTPEPPPIPSILTADAQALQDRRHPSVLEKLFGRRRVGQADAATDRPIERSADDPFSRDEQTAELLRQVQTIWNAPEPSPPPAREEPPPSPGSASIAQDRGAMVSRIAEMTPDGIGSPDLPEREDALEALLALPPNDYLAQDLLRACWPQRGVTSRAALAVARNLSRPFGRTGRLPLAAAQSWRLLDPDLFRPAMTRQLAEISDFILAGQRPNAPVLCLEHGEIDLIEYLFETLEPGENLDLLASVMAFKCLSGRRFGLVRRVPARARRRIESLAPTARAETLPRLFLSRALLLRLSDQGGFPPLADAALRAQAEIETLIEQIGEGERQ